MSRNDSSRPALCHFEPVEFLFHFVKRIVADLVVGPHGENSLSRRLKGRAAEVAVREARVRVWIGSFRCQMCCELLADCLSDR